MDFWKKLVVLCVLVLLAGCIRTQSVGKAAVGDSSPPEPLRDNPYLTLAFSYSDAIHDPDHNYGLGEDEIVGWYDYLVVGESTFENLQDYNKPKVFLYVDVWGKDSANQYDYQIVPAPPFFVTENFPEGHGVHPVNYVGGDYTTGTPTNPYCFIQTDGYYEDLYNVLSDFLDELDAQGTNIAGIFLDDFARVSSYWYVNMDPADIEACWPGRGETQAEWDDWWSNEQWPRMRSFVDDLHDLLFGHYGRSELIVNGGLRQYITIDHPDYGSILWPKYYDDEFSTPNKLTRRCFEGPTVDTDNYIDFGTILKPFDEGYLYYRKFYPKDLLLIYAIDGNPDPSGCEDSGQDPQYNGGYGDWYVGGIYNGLLDWTTGTDAANDAGGGAIVALSYGGWPCTGGTRLSFFSNPTVDGWPYFEQEPPPDPICGDGNIDPGEECDGLNLDGESCKTLGYTGGILACSDECKFDMNGCFDGYYDMNGDNVIDIIDLSIVANDFHKAFNHYPGGDTDVNDDGKVNILDLVLVATHFT